MKIVLPEHGAYTRDKDTGEVRAMPYIYAIHDRPDIYIALPSSTWPTFSIFDDIGAAPAIAYWRKAVYKRMEEPNCHGIARYDLVRVE